MLLSKNPLNQKYQEKLLSEREQFKQCSFYISRKKRQCSRRCADDRNVCSLHTAEGLEREREKGRQNRRVYDARVDEECNVVLTDMVSSLHLWGEMGPEEKRTTSMFEIMERETEKSITQASKSNLKRRQRVSAPNRMVNPLSQQYLMELTPAKTNWSLIYKHCEKPLHIDIGCARGEFLMRLAADKRWAEEYNFLGCEIRPKLVEEANLRSKEQNQKNNIHFIDGQFLYFAKELFTSLQNANISVKSISIQFPDPWRRKKHEKRLLVQPKLVGMLADVLPIGAVVYFCSDVEAEVKRMDSVFCKNEQFVTGEPTKELYPFVSVPTERTLVCENMHRAVWTGMAQKRGVSM